MTSGKNILGLKKQSLREIKWAFRAPVNHGQALPVPVRLITASQS